MEDFESIDHATEDHAGNVRVGDYLWRNGTWMRVTDIYVSVNTNGDRVISLNGSSPDRGTYRASDIISVHQYPDWLTRQRNGR